MTLPLPKTINKNRINSVVLAFAYTNNPTIVEYSTV